jgi:hypothetical protein
LPHQDSEIRNLKKWINQFRSQIHAETQGFLRHFSVDETSIILKAIYKDSEYNMFLDLIPVWIRNYKHPAEDHLANDKKRFRDAFNRMYLLKITAITGSGQTPDGKEKRPVWDAKTNSLLKGDMEAHGLENMKFYMMAFFSDKIPEVANFTRYKQKAGYGYSVFHGMLGKLTQYDYNSLSFSLCPECGEINGHKSSCPIEIRKRQKAAAERREAEQYREANPDIDLVGMFKQTIKEKHNDK